MERQRGGRDRDERWRDKGRGEIEMRDRETNGRER